MGRVVVQCPNTGAGVTVDTGFSVDRASFQKLKVRDCVFRCSSCGQYHTWNKEDAILEEDE